MKLVLETFTFQVFMNCINPFRNNQVRTCGTLGDEITQGPSDGARQAHRPAAGSDKRKLTLNAANALGISRGHSRAGCLDGEIKYDVVARIGEIHHAFDRLGGFHGK
jgi:hypothetical protein